MWRIPPEKRNLCPAGQRAMSELYINKLAAAQRQFDAAVRMYFDQEDELAVLTLGHAALGVCEGVFETRHPGVLTREVRCHMEDGIRSLRKGTGAPVPEGWRLEDSDKQILAFVKRHRNEPANYLKHADKDSSALLHISQIDVDTTLLETLGLLMRLHVAASPEQLAFAKWHLAVYPSEPSDELRTGVEKDERRLFVHELEKSEQKEVGKILLELYYESH